MSETGAKQRFEENEETLIRAMLACVPDSELADLFPEPEYRAYLASRFPFRFTGETVKR